MEYSSVQHFIRGYRKGVMPPNHSVIAWPIIVNAGEASRTEISAACYVIKPSVMTSECIASGDMSVTKIPSWYPGSPM